MAKGKNKIIPSALSVAELQKRLTTATGRVKVLILNELTKRGVAVAK